MYIATCMYNGLHYNSVHIVTRPSLPGSCWCGWESRCVASGCSGGDGARWFSHTHFPRQAEALGPAPQETGPRLQRSVCWRCWKTTWYHNLADRKLLSSRNWRAWVLEIWIYCSSLAQISTHDISCTVFLVLDSILECIYPILNLESPENLWGLEFLNQVFYTCYIHVLFCPQSIMASCTWVTAT